MARVARKAKSPGNKSGKGKAHSATTGRYVTAKYDKRSPSTNVKESRKGATRDAGEFADRFMERYPGTFHELSKR